MSRYGNNNGEGVGDDPVDAPLPGGQATALQQLCRLRSDIEEQGWQVGMAVDTIVEVPDRGGSIPPEMMSHLKAQILKAHMLLDDLDQTLDAPGWQVP